MTFRRLGEILGTSTQAAERYTLPPGHPRRIKLSLEKARLIRKRWPDFDIDTYDQPADSKGKPSDKARKGSPANRTLNTKTRAAANAGRA